MTDTNDIAFNVQFGLKLGEWLHNAQQLITIDYATRFPQLSVPQLSLQQGKRYVKVVRSDDSGSRSVHCFIDTKNGDVLKAASWKAPAKGARGNIFTEALGVSSYGGLYLR